MSSIYPAPPPPVPPPPPYHPHFPDSPSAPVFPSALISSPGTFPGSPYQTFPQSYTGGGDLSYYHQPQGPLMSQPGYQGGPPGAPYPSKHTVYLVDRQQEESGGGAGGGKSWLAVASAAMCCCSLLPMAFQHCC